MEQSKPRTPDEIRQALTDLETIWELAKPVNEMQERECVGVAAALRWALGEEGGTLDLNLREIREILGRVPRQ